MFCTNCGKELLPEEKKCLECGQESKDIEKLDETWEDQATKNELLEESETLKEKSQKREPISTASFFFMQVVFLIPLVNLFFLLFWSFNKGTNVNRRSFARANLIWTLSFSVLFLFVVITLLFLKVPLDTDVWFKIFRGYINNI